MKKSFVKDPDDPDFDPAKDAEGVQVVNDGGPGDAKVFGFSDLLDAGVPSSGSEAASQDEYQYENCGKKDLFRNSHIRTLPHCS